MGAPRLIGSLFFTLLIVLTLPTLILIGSAKQTLLTPDIYVQTIDQIEITTILEQAVGAFEDGEPGAEKAGQQLIDAISNELKSNPEIETDLKGQLKNITINLFSYVNGETQELNTNISLVEIKPALLDTLTNVMIESVPDCEPGQEQQQVEGESGPSCMTPEAKVLLPKILAGEEISNEDVVSAIPACGLFELPQLEGPLPSCVTEQSRQKLLQQLNEQGFDIREMISGTDGIGRPGETADLGSGFGQGLPDSVELIPNGPQIQQVREVVAMINTAIVGSLITILVLLALLFFINRKSKKLKLRWVGLPLLISSLLLGGLLFSASMLTPQLFSQLEKQLSGAPAFATTMLTGILNSLITRIFINLEIAAGVLFVIGLALVAYSFLAAKKVGKEGNRDK
ncbi:MAG: hypothetical protein J4432_01470 [DPANN group archaeon]|nr:hypothetical protein [DPANN group archaeon]